MKVLVLGHNNYYGDLGNIPMYNFWVHFENTNSVLISVSDWKLHFHSIFYLHFRKRANKGQSSFNYPYLHESIFEQFWVLPQVIFDHLRKVSDIIWWTCVQVVKGIFWSGVLQRGIVEERFCRSFLLTLLPSTSVGPSHDLQLQLTAGNILLLWRGGLCTAEGALQPPCCYKNLAT